MPAYLKFENIGICPAEGFTVLGAPLNLRLQQRDEVHTALRQRLNPTPIHSAL